MNNELDYLKTEINTPLIMTTKRIANKRTVSKARIQVSQERDFVEFLSGWMGKRSAETVAPFFGASGNRVRSWLGILPGQKSTEPSTSMVPLLAERFGINERDVRAMIAETKRRRCELVTK